MLLLLGAYLVGMSTVLEVLLRDIVAYGYFALPGHKLRHPRSLGCGEAI
jgi:hypothetical protein